MAAGDPLHDLCEEASCSICLDFFRDPVTIAECGHNFCRACLTRSWGERSGAAEPSCPQCRGRAQPSSLRPNQQLANFVEIAERVALQEAAVAAGKGRVCQNHQEPLKLFCKDDEALICMVCDRSKAHRDHEVLPLEEASQEYKDQFCNCLEILKKERERIVAYKRDIERESQDLLKQTQGEKQEAVAKFRQLHTFLEEQEKLLLAQMEEVEMEVAKKRDQHLAELSEALSSLESLIREMEEKCQHPVSDFLQHLNGIFSRYEEKESFENPVDFPLALKWHIWYFSHFNPPLEIIKRQFKDTLDSGLHLQKANVTLDPDTASPWLILSEGQKSVQIGEKPQALPTSPERFEKYLAVLGCEGFTGGCHFWEVIVGSEESWIVGVASKSVRRKGGLTFAPEEGIWAVGKWAGMHRVCIKAYPPLTVTGELKRIRVCLNYAGGRVAFFDADRAALLYEFSGASFFGATLLPFFWVYGKGHLKISS
ncbi:E3 ubiquitin-protein ligase TRIM7-like isoform X4 [Heteronotia binoei]|uniref:E3 ubiquitin-protein ligase TRIM7-like isoform X4 n=1 Tax=Heteronotia binoei TaxID=13085 RepID=UPI0029304EC9|nr:E3 ubiquitin-protein ligase TRIM7-like isoform X4 [Heteronotia binoei]